MSSTRNKNSPNDYCHERKMSQHILDNRLYPYSGYGHSNHPAIPMGGIAPASYIGHSQLSENPVQIESQLFGIGSSNLVTLYRPDIARIKRLPDAKFFDRNPVIMPDNLIVRKYQRALLR